MKPATRFAVMSTSSTRADVLNCLSAGFPRVRLQAAVGQRADHCLNDLFSGRIYVPRWLADGDGYKTEVPLPLMSGGKAETHAPPERHFAAARARNVEQGNCQTP